MHIDMRDIYYSEFNFKDIIGIVGCFLAVIVDSRLVERVLIFGLSYH